MTICLSLMVEIRRPLGGCLVNRYDFPFLNKMTRAAKAIILKKEKSENWKVNYGFRFLDICPTQEQKKALYLLYRRTKLLIFPWEMSKILEHALLFSGSLFLVRTWAPGARAIAFRQPISILLNALA